MRKSALASIALIGAFSIASIGPGYALAPSAPTPEQGKVRVLFAGDMMFDRSVREYAAQKGGDYLFECIDPTLRSSDFVVANLEGPITESPSRSVGSIPGSPNNFVFTFPTSTAELLRAHGIGAVSLGNNHIHNFGEAGVRSTIEWLDRAGVRHFGDPLGFSSADIDLRGVPLTFIAYNEFIPEKEGTTESTLSLVKDAAARGRVPVVLAHWGNEYEVRAASRTVVLAHAFVEAGARAIIGAHPHVVQQSEIYLDAPIYYSLGNFIFDQYFSPDVMRGLLVELEFSAAGAATVREVPTVLTPDRRVCAAG